METILKLQNITKKYSDKKNVIVACENISLEIKAGEAVSLLGLNGAGKTTLINIISTFLPPTSGTGKIFNFDLSKSVEIKKRIGVLNEKNPLYEKMTVKNFLTFSQNMYGIDDKNLIEGLCDKWNLTKYKNSIIEKLSKGFKQRVGLVACIVHKPKLLILDEPTSGLDAIQQTEFEKNILELLPKTTLILCTHDLPLASRICTKHIMLNAGKVFCSGSILDFQKELYSKNIIKDGENISVEDVLKEAFINFR